MEKWITILQRSTENHKIMFSLFQSNRVNGVYRVGGITFGVSTSYRNTGKKEIEEWKKRVKFARFAGPALTYYYDNGMVKEERWVQNGKIHRLSCPATTFYYENGMKRTENGIRTESYTVYRVLL